MRIPVTVQKTAFRKDCGSLSAAGINFLHRLTRGAIPHFLNPTVLKLRKKNLKLMTLMAAMKTKVRYWLAT